jgi:hypothetical protein
LPQTAGRGVGPRRNSPPTWRPPLPARDLGRDLPSDRRTHPQLVTCAYLPGVAFARSGSRAGTTGRPSSGEGRRGTACWGQAQSDAAPHGPEPSARGHVVCRRDPGTVLSLRIINVLGCEVSLETGFHWSGSYPTRPVPRRVAAAAPMRSTNSPVRTTRTRTQDARMPDARTGHWTTRTGHRTRGRWTGGRWTRTGRRTQDRGTPDTRTLTQDADRATKARWASGHPGTTAPLDPEPCCFGRRHAALGNHDGSAVRPPASARHCRLHCQAAAGSLRRRPSGASAHCSPQTITGRA